MIDVQHVVPSPPAAPDHTVPDEDDAGGLTRSGLFRLISRGGAGAAGLSLIMNGHALAAPAPSVATDLTILEYALTLEYLGAAFYDSALRQAKLRGESRDVATKFRAHERAHVVFVRNTISTLGGRPHASQRFDFGAATRSEQAFLRTSAMLEEMCVQTLNGAAPLVSTPVLIGASKLVSVEARQATWVRNILGRLPAPFTFNPFLTAAESQARLRATGFVRS
ncbi:MAG: ferritin-like domain-containing protein [Solirubrobacteraceae bacterium]